MTPSAAVFYGKILDWASGLPGCCEVEYAGGGVQRRGRDDIVATTGLRRCFKARRVPSTE
ncbi:hypothetical protein [Streptomyces roseochromogenus]|uniref:hypothetical protein n=1 Tax=Streptomyces roseochromogenus TaxID=285450 RepID=UPI001ADF5357|nr:hypothetical protein [Streptomyces roseochromogenus]